jgi:hypothetical protein
VCGGLAGLAFVAPRFVPDSEGGFAAGAAAVLVFLASLAVTTVVALYLLALTVRAWPALSTGARLAGVAPGIVLVAALILLLGWLRS